MQFIWSIQSIITIHIQGHICGCAKCVDEQGPTQCRVLRGDPDFLLDAELHKVQKWACPY